MSGFPSPERPSSPSPDTLREEVRQKTQPQLREREDTAGMPIAESVPPQANDPDHERTIQIRKWNGLIERMTSVQTLYRPQIEQNRPILEQELPDVAQGEIAAITDAILELPVADESTKQKHRYLTSRRITDRESGMDPWFYFQINWNQVDADEAMLADLKKAFPHRFAELTTLQNAIEEMTRQDPEWGVHEYRRRERANPSKLDTAVIKSGKMGLFLVCVAGTVFTGVVSIANKRFSAAPLLYAAVAGLIASPKLRQMFFSPKLQNTLNGINATLSKEFVALCNAHGIRGKGWMEVAEAIANEGGKKKPLLKKLRAAEKGSIPSEAETYITELTTDEAIRAQLRSMASDGTLAYFIEQLQRTSTSDAKNVVLDYINLGCSKYAKDARTIKQSAQEQSVPPTAATATASTPPPFS